MSAYKEIPDPSTIQRIELDESLTLGEWALAVYEATMRQVVLKDHSGIVLSDVELPDDAAPGGR